MKNSILASPTRGLGTACYASGNGPTPASLGHNIVSDASANLGGPGDLNNTNPLLGALASNGGPTQTHKPLPGSPALNAVPLADCTDANGIPITTDQRGVARPQGLACEIGSVEIAFSTESRLSNLVPSQGALTPGFFPDTTSYTGTVASLTLTPTALGSGATVQVNGTPVASGSASGSIALNLGANVITVVCTAQDGVVATSYTAAHQVCGKC